MTFIGTTQLVTLTIAVASLAFSTWSLVETKRQESPFKITSPHLQDVLPPGQEVDKAQDVGYDPDFRSLFEAPSLGCSNSCGTTYCLDKAFVFTGSLSVNSGCYPYSEFSRYLAYTQVPNVQADHVAYGVTGWLNAGYNAACSASTLDYEIYNVVGTSDCVTSVDFAIVTQLSRSASTGLGSCGGGGSGGGGSLSRR
ncbi:MAG: hypothetical protein SGARI_002140 [Bacillariaceae sp.]